MGRKLSKDKLIKRSDAKADKANKKENGKGWTKRKKIALGVIVAGVLATVIFAILLFVFDFGPVRPIASSDEDSRVVGRCAGFEIKYEELRYVTHAKKGALDKKYGEYNTLDAESKAKYESELQEIVSAELRNNYAILSLCEKYGMDIDSKEAKKYVNEAISDFVDEVGGKKAYRAWLDENKLTDSFLRLLYKVNYLEGALVEKLTAEGKEIKYSQKNLDEFVDFVMEDSSYVKVIHAYYPNDFEYGEGKDARSSAEAALETIKAAENDEERLSLMSSAIGRAPFVPGYSTQARVDFYITFSQMHRNYEDVAFSLEEYEVSSLLELEESYYILMRVPKDREDVAPNAYNLVEQYGYAVVKRMIDTQKELVSFEADRYFVTLTLAEID